MAKIGNSFITALDIGATKVVCFIAKLTPQKKISIVGIGHQVSQGIKSGVITDIKLAEQSIRLAVGAAEAMAGVTIDKTFVNISENKQKSNYVKAELNINGHEITKKDIHRLTSQGCEQFKNEDREVIHCIAVDYSLDGATGIIEPIGMYGHDITADLHIITASSPTILNLTNCVAQSHLNIEGYISSAYASGLACLSEDEKDLGTVVVDLGGSSTSVAIFKGGRLRYVDNIAVGSMNITKDIAIGLSTSIESAERLKALHGNVLSTAKDNQEIIDVPNIGEEDDDADENHITKVNLINIIRPRVEEILELVASKILNSGYGKTIAHVVLTGGGSHLGGISELTGQILKKQVRIGIPKYIDGMAESTKGPAFSTCAGMLLLAAHHKEMEYSNFEHKTLFSNSFIGKMAGWFKENF